MNNTPRKTKTQPATDELTLLLEARNALRVCINAPEATANTIAKASNELRHVLQRISILDATAPKDPETDPIEALKKQIQLQITTPRKTTPKRPTLTKQTNQ